MKTALWPATLGYFLETMLAPVFGDDDGRATRAGSSPATSAAAARSRRSASATSRTGSCRRPRSRGSRWLDRRRPARARRFLRRPARRLLRTHGRRLARRCAGGVARVGTAAATRTPALLDVLGLHPASVEFHQRYAESLEHLLQPREPRRRAGATWSTLLRRAASTPTRRELLERLGYGGERSPAVLAALFHGRHRHAARRVVDDRPLSETAAGPRLDRTTGATTCAWLADAARASLDALRLQDGFTDDRPPTALLYLCCATR